MKAIFISEYDSNSKRSWSGTPFYMKKALQKQGVSFVDIDNIKSNIKPFVKMCSYILKKVSNYRLDADHSLIVSFELGVKVSKKIKNIDADFILAPAGSSIISFLKTDIPIVYLSDTTFSQLLHYYTPNERLPKFFANMSEIVESRAIKKSSLVSFPSDWATDYAKNKYSHEGIKFEKIEWGANLDSIPRCKVRNLSKSETINFLFVGVDWQRKGGDLVFETCNRLIELGLNVHLTICGCNPDINEKNLDWITIYQHLDKNNIEDFEVLESLYEHAHFLFVPSTSECYGIVFCEAGAYSLPIISRCTGGISTIVEDDYNGILLPEDEDNSIEYLVKRIISVIDNKTYTELAGSSRYKYENVCNWDNWAFRLINLIEK